MAKQTNHIHVLMDDETLELLDAIAKKRGVSRAEAIRHVIKRSARILIGRATGR